MILFRLQRRVRPRCARPGGEIGGRAWLHVDNVEHDLTVGTTGIAGRAIAGPIDRHSLHAGHWGAQLGEVSGEIMGAITTPQLNNRNALAVSIDAEWKVVESSELGGREGVGAELWRGIPAVEYLVGRGLLAARNRGGSRRRATPATLRTPI